jgi:hypothetical protein
MENPLNVLDKPIFSGLPFKNGAALEISFFATFPEKSTLPMP